MKGGATFHIIPLLIIFLSMPQTHNANPTNNNTLTDELIHKICSKTMKPSLCQKVLEPSKGNTTLSSLSDVARCSMAQDQGSSRATYYTCSTMYASDIKGRIARASVCMAECMLLIGEYAKCVKKWIEVALKRADLKCGKPLMNMNQARGRLGEANGVFLDFCSAVLAVCKEVKCHSKVKYIVE